MTWQLHGVDEDFELFGVLREDPRPRLRRLNQLLDAAGQHIREFCPERALAAVNELEPKMHVASEPYWLWEGTNHDQFVQLQKVITEIEEELESRLGADLPFQQLPESVLREKWNLGTRRVLIGQKQVLRGKLVLGQDLPLVRPLRPLTVLYLSTIAVSGLKDELIREIHGHWGYHYHYCVYKKGRSDTILSFGGSSAAPKLFHETHAEHKAQAEARPNTWKGEKRQSVYGACLPDLKKWSVSDFKVPGKDAGVVWPVTCH